MPERVESARIIPIPSLNPRVKGFGFLVPVAVVPFGGAKMPTPGETTYAQLKFGAKERMAELRDYVYVDDEAGPEGYWMYKFVPPLTDAERNRPYLSWETDEMYTWPEELRAVEFFEDPVFPVKVPATWVWNEVAMTGAWTADPKYVPRVFSKRRVLPVWSGMTRCLVERFISDRKWPGVKRRHVQPVPDEVSYDFFGASDSRRCIHPEIVIPERLSVHMRKIYGMGTRATARDPRQGGQRFPATAMATREKFVFSDEQGPMGIFWARERRTYFPPEDQEEVLV